MDLSLSDRKSLSEAFLRMARDLPQERRIRAEIEADRFAGCGRRKRVYRCDRDGHQFGLRCSCNSRVCPSCARRYAVQLRRALERELAPWWSHRSKSFGPKFLTLTFQQSRFGADLPSGAELDRCYREAREFVTRFYHKFAGRRSRNGNWYLDRKRWRGAGAFLMIEASPRGAVHFHLLCYGPYIPQNVLAGAWYGITGDSSIVDVRGVKNARHAVNYVLKYISKVPAFDGFTSLAAWGLALKGKRRFMTYGVMYGRVKKERRPRERLSCLFCGDPLKYGGEHDDPHDNLIDYVTLRKYCDPENGGYYRSYLYGSPVSPDKNLNERA